MITVDIPFTEFIDLDPRISIESHIVSKLRKAGIPVIGVFSLRGVSEGTISFTRDHNDTLKFVWENDGN